MGYHAMKKATVIAVLLNAGIEPHRIVETFTDAGLRIGVTVVAPNGRRGLVQGLVPIDDRADAAFAHALVRKADGAETQK